MQFLERIGRPLVVILALLSSIAWRLAADGAFEEVSRSFSGLGLWFGLALSSATLLLAILIGLRRTEAPATRSGPWIPILLTAALLTCAMEPVGLWPCETTCANKGAYALLWGIKLTELALLPLALLATLAWLDWRRPLAAWACWPIWLVIGGSIYFIALAAGIELACGHCFQLHTWLLAAAFLQLRLPPAWPAKLLLILVGGFGLHAAYHPYAYYANADPSQPTPYERLQRSGSGPGSGGAPPTDFLQARQLRLLFAANAGRQRGRLDAPVVATLVLGLHCEHCAAVLPQIEQELQPLLDDGTLRLIYNWAYARGNDQSQRLASWAVSAAAIGQLDAFHERFLGIGIDADPGELDTRLDGGLAILGKNPFPMAALLPLLESDRQRLAEIRVQVSETPVLALRRGGKTWATWTKHMPLEDIVARIRKLAAEDLDGAD